MVNIEDYNAKMNEIQSILDENVQTPTFPVDVTLQETENLHYWSLDDASTLTVVGITTDMINDFTVRI